MKPNSIWCILSLKKYNLIFGKLHKKNKESCHLSLFELQTFSLLTSPFSNHSYHHHHILMQPPLPLKHGSYLSSKAHPAVLCGSWCCFGRDRRHAAATRPGGDAKQRGNIDCFTKHKQNIIQQIYPSSFCHAMIHGHVSNNQRSSNRALSNALLGWRSMQAGTCQTYAYERFPKNWKPFATWYILNQNETSSQIDDWMIGLLRITTSAMGFGPSPKVASDNFESSPLKNKNQEAKTLCSAIWGNESWNVRN